MKLSWVGYIWQQESVESLEREANSAIGKYFYIGNFYTYEFKGTKKIRITVEEIE